MTAWARVKVAHLIATSALAAASAGVLVAGPASATTVDECQATLTQLSESLNADAAGFTNASDVERLDAKVNDAESKLVLGKNADATQKLGDFRTTLSLLATAPKPKVDSAVAADLDAQAQQSVSCIEGIGA